MTDFTETGMWRYFDYIDECIKDGRDCILDPYELRSLVSEVLDLRSANERLISHGVDKNKIEELEGTIQDQADRIRTITSTYEGMRTRLDMAFGAPDDEDPCERRAKGRPAGLMGAVDFAIAKHAQVARQLHEDGYIDSLTQEMNDWKEMCSMWSEQFDRVSGFLVSHGWKGDQDLFDKAKPIRERLKIGEFAEDKAE